MDQLQEQNLFDLEVTEETKSILTGLSLWMLIMAISGLVSAGFGIISTARLMIRYRGLSFFNSFSMLSLLMPLISIAISLLLNITLLNAANSLKKALLSADQYSMNRGMGKMANYFRISGILIICALVIFAVLMVFGIIMAAARGLR